uniref:Uncharacterized protein n=1 Tax=Arundo donax TaxID=35708 RepID=A0A0A8ZFP0_ARUDO
MGRVERCPKWLKKYAFSVSSGQPSKEGEGGYI